MSATESFSGRPCFCHARREHARSYSNMVSGFVDGVARQVGLSAAKPNAGRTPRWASADKAGVISPTYACSNFAGSAGTLVGGSDPQRSSASATPHAKASSAMPSIAANTATADAVQ